jgi:hypothetical protein
MTRRFAIAALVVLASLAAGCGGSSSHASAPAGSPQATARNPQLTDLHNVNQLRVLFNKASRQPRLIILVAPT